MDSFASIDAQVGKPSDLQEQRRFDSSDNLSHGSPETPLSLSPAGGAAPLTPADAPILICSLPDTPSHATPTVAGAADVSLGLELPEAGTKGPSPVTTGAHQPSLKSPSPALVGEVTRGGRLVSRSSSNRWKKKCRASRWQLRRRQIKSPAKRHGGLAGEGPPENDPFEKYRFQPREVVKCSSSNPCASLKIVPGPINPSALTQNPPSSEREASKQANREDGVQSKCQYHPQEVLGGITRSPNSAANVVPGPGKSPVLIQNPPPELGEAGSTSVSCGENPPPPSVPSPVASPAAEPQLSLLDIIKTFSEEPDMKHANTDILDIMEMKGIEILPPQWWRPGGYGDLEHSILE